MKKLMNFFDGDISKKDIQNALSRFTVLLTAIVCSVLVLDYFQSDTAVIDLTMNPLYSIAQDTTLHDTARAEAMDKLTVLASQRQATTFWQTILHSTILMFFWIIVASISTYAFTKLKWTEDLEHGLIGREDYQKQKMNALMTIFGVVFITGSIIYLADKL